MRFHIGFTAEHSERAALPQSKAVTWFKAPKKEDDEYVSGSDDSSFPLNDLTRMKVSDAIAARGRAYYADRSVRYISVDGTKGYAIVEGRAQRGRCVQNKTIQKNCSAYRSRYALFFFHSRLA